MAKPLSILALELLFLLLSVLPGSAAGDSMPADAEVAAGLRRFMQEAAGEGFTGAVLVARHGKVLLDEGYGFIAPGSQQAVTPETVFTTGSITKQFTAAAILVLEERGRLDVQDHITTYFSSVPADKQGITLHQLLTHTAGFPGAIGDDFERIRRDAFVERAMAKPLLFAPGSRYAYSNVGYSLLAAVVEMVSGEDYETFLRRNLFEPAGMTDTGYRLPAWEPARLAHGCTDAGDDWGTLVGRALGKSGPGWNLVGNGGMHSTVHDMYKWHQALRGETILSAEAQERMYAKHADEGGGSWYGYGWSIEETPWGRLITHNGGNPYFFADLLRFDRADVFIYYTSSSRERRMRRLARPLARIVYTGEVPALPVSPPTESGMLAATGPAAPEGSLAAKWGLPGSYRGKRAAELLEAITTEDVEWRRQFIADGFAPTVLASRDVGSLESSLAGLQRELGPCQVVRAWPDGSGVVVELGGAGVPTRLEVALEAEPPHRIVSIGVVKGD
jgi:CubicO group peptidase (beta-lactamase class C family)